MKGTVKFFNRSKGFGFITGEDGKDYFTHESDLQDEIREDDQVEFEPKEGKHGISEAANVKHAR